MNNTFTSIKIAAAAIVLLSAMSAQLAFSQATSPSARDVDIAVDYAELRQRQLYRARDDADENQQRAEDRLNHATTNRDEANSKLADVNGDPNSTQWQRDGAQRDADAANSEFDLAQRDARVNGDPALRTALTNLREARVTLATLHGELVNNNTRNGRDLRRKISRCLRDTKPRAMVAMGSNPGRKAAMVAMGSTRTQTLAVAKGGHKVRRVICNQH